MDLGHRPALDRAQQHVRVRGMAKHQDRRRIGGLGVVQRAREAEVAIGDARPAEERDLLRADMVRNRLKPVSRPLCKPNSTGTQELDKPEK